MAVRQNLTIIFLLSLVVSSSGLGSISRIFRIFCRVTRFDGKPFVLFKNNLTNFFSGSWFLHPGWAPCVKKWPSNSTCSVLVRISMDKSELWPINNKFLSGYCYWLQSSFWHQRNSYSLRNLTGLFLESADPPK